MIPLLHKGLIAYNGYSSGLGNRVRVVLGCRSLADLEQRSFAHVWPTGRLFGPRLDELWHIREPRVSRVSSRLLTRIFPYVDESLDWLDEAKRRERIWQIRTGSPIRLPPGARDWKDDFRELVPVDEIAVPVGRVFDAELRGSPYVGVMIRAHASMHDESRRTSPVDWFVSRMEQVRSADPDVRFYVSCDVDEVAEDVAARIPGCVFQRGKGAYNSTAAVRASIVDLYLLAGSGYLIGPHFSSFVHLAEHLAGDRLTFETAVASPATAVDHRAQGLVSDPLRPSDRAVEPPAAAGTDRR